MKTLYFEVELKTDIILNQKAITQGANTTLDYIPGSNFLGIVAGALYDDNFDRKLAMDLFHNGTVRFGDAHLKAESGARALKVPADFFYPKGKEPNEVLYVSHLVPDDEQTQEEMRKIQLKQCRKGYYDFTATDKVARPVKCDTNFAIKSAHDRQTRTSLEDAMFGYESLQAGAKMLFEVQIEKNESELEPLIVDALTKGSSKRVGRSRSAQYGLVEIRQLPEAYKQVSGLARKGTVLVYADSRLIFLDEETGLPTFQPTAEQLGLEGGKINWDKSQIRTFQYAPWNFKRQCFDTDRCGLEKGSVIVVEGVTEVSPLTETVGSYKNEGFGRVIYNPDFLEGDAKGLAVWKLQKSDTSASTKAPEEQLTLQPTAPNDTPLMARLKELHNQEITENKIFELANNWKNEKESLFKQAEFASQWGTIRSIATRRLLALEPNQQKTLYDELFAEGIGYLKHGVAQAKWEERGRAKAFEHFFKYDLAEFPDDDAQCLAVINLAAEMSKLYRKEKENKK